MLIHFNLSECVWLSWTLNPLKSLIWDLLLIIPFSCSCSRTGMKMLTISLTALYFLLFSLHTVMLEQLAKHHFWVQLWISFSLCNTPDSSPKKDTTCCLCPSSLLLLLVFPISFSIPPSKKISSSPFYLYSFI